jgi:hypothetical protein
MGRQVVQISVDDFHNVSAVRTSRHFWTFRSR